MVKRYVCIEGYNLDDKHGDWVRYDDYAELLTEFERLRAMIDVEVKPIERNFRERPTHSVYRGGVCHLPCHCLADADHVIGYEQLCKGEGQG